MTNAILPLFAIACVLSAQEDHPATLQQAMAAARKRVERLESSVPNFICSEQIISQLFLDDKLRKETRAQSLLTTTRGEKEGHGTFTETRAEMRINGKPSKKKEIAGPFVWQGGPAYGDLHFLFNSEMGATCLARELIGHVQLSGRDALLIETHTQSISENDRSEYDRGCRELRADSADKIWLDLKTLNVMRVESHDPPATRIPGADLTLTVDYAAVSFDGAEYWLPSHFVSRLDFPGTSRRLQYEAFFSDYHKYVTESSFHVDPDQ